MKAEARIKLELCLLVVLVALFYHPALFAGVNDIDDSVLFRQLLNTQDWDVWGVLFPGYVGLYYRPIVTLSFFIDANLFGLEPVLSHLFNLVLHTANAVLVYWLTRYFIGQDGKRRLVPLSVALLFALNPLTTESVVWISGRTDLLATLFVLLAFCVLFTLPGLRTGLRLVISCLLLLLALGSKEVALAAVPAIILFWMAQRKQASRRSVLNWLWFGLATAAAGVVLLLVRKYAFSGASSRIHDSLALIFTSPLESGLTFLGALGFYLKKVLVPLPNSFAIVSISPLYALLGATMMLIALLCLRRKGYAGAGFASALLFLVPALPVALGFIAWTPYAERYAYLASAFFMLAIVGWCATALHDSRMQQVALVSTAAIIFFMGTATYARSSLWQDSVAFYQDTVAHAPAFYAPHNFLGNAYLKKGNYRAAEREFRLAREQLDGPPARFNLLMGVLRAREQNAEAALQHLASAIQQETEERYRITAYKLYLEMAEKTLLRRNSGLDGDELLKDLIRAYVGLAQLNGDPHKYYRAGQLALSAGDSAEARRNLQKAYAGYPPGDPYRVFAQKLLNHLDEAAQRDATHVERR